MDQQPQNQNPSVVIVEKGNKGMRNCLIIGGILFVVGAIGVVATIGGCAAIFSIAADGAKKEQAKAREALELQKSDLQKSDSQTTEISEIRPMGELEQMFKLGSPYTDIQRENKIAELKGKIVVWTLPVYEISKQDDNKYRVITNGDNYVDTKITLYIEDEKARKYVEALNTGSFLKFKGIIKDVSLRTFIIEPALPIIE